LGTHTVKLAQLEKRAGTIRLAEALIIRRPQPWQVCDEGSQVGPWESRHEIRAALSLGANFHGRNAAVTLPMAVCDMRECQIPAGAEQDQCWEPVAQELKAAWGNTFDQRELGIWAADQPVDRGKSNKNVFAFSIQQTWAARIARDMSQSGLRGQVLDGLPLALGRAVQLGGNCVANEPVVAVDWGYQRASLCAVWNGHPYYVRCLKGGGLIAVVEALCSTLPVTPEEAQQLLTEQDYQIASLTVVRTYRLQSKR
jgi:Tfp pilus assembly PilM family ATPase